MKKVYTVILEAMSFGRLTQHVKVFETFDLAKKFIDDSVKSQKYIEGETNHTTEVYGTMADNPSEKVVVHSLNWPMTSNVLYGVKLCNMYSSETFFSNDDYFNRFVIETDVIDSEDNFWKYDELSVN